MTEVSLPDELLQPKPDVEFTLPNGVKVQMWEPDGGTLERALKLTPKKSEAASSTTYALISLSATFDGKRLRYEDIRSMKMRQLSVLMREFNKLATGADPLEKVEEKQSSD